MKIKLSINNEGVKLSLFLRFGVPKKSSSRDEKSATNSQNGLVYLQIRYQVSQYSMPSCPKYRGIEASQTRKQNSNSHQKLVEFGIREKRINA